MKRPETSFPSPAPPAPRAVVFGVAGERLGAAEARFFAAADPLGFILFRRNCRSPEEVRDLVMALRATVGRASAPVLIDQEGGRVARLGPPHWRRYPAAGDIAALPEPPALEAAWLGARLMADDLVRLGISIDCLPVLDLLVDGADPVIGDRAYGRDPGRVARLGRAVCEGLIAGGVLPVLKHIPGHGRAGVDSHAALPSVDTAHDELSRTDFAPFRVLAAMPWAMTAHIIYMAIDPAAPATLSRRIIAETIRGEIGFAGVLVSDDLSMQALGAVPGCRDIGERAAKALAAGVDIVLHCNGDPAEMEAVAARARPLTAAALARLAGAEAMRGPPAAFDREGGERRFEALLAGAVA
jgi:beta-N-acetylhexosaminidase